MSTQLIPLTEEGNTPEKAKKILQQVGETFGMVPNYIKTLAHSPAVLHSLWEQIKVGQRMKLPARIREGIALRVAQLNGCTYCLAAHAAVSRGLKVDEETIRQFRRGCSNDTKEQAILALVSKIVTDRGLNTGFVFDTAKKVGITDEEILELIALVGLNTFSNYVNNVVNIEIDFPLVEELD